MNLDAYFTHLGIARPSAPTLEALGQIHVAHLGAFPFHNLTIQRGGEVTVDVDSIAGRFLREGGGGYCFEQNTLLGAVLRELGFAVTTLLARVGPEGSGVLNHMLLRVDIDGRPWIADVGFGGEGLLEPLPLHDGARATQCGIEFALRRDAHQWTLSMQHAGSSDDLYHFSGAPSTQDALELANDFTSRHPASIFRNTFTIQRVTPGERIILRPRVVTRYRNGVRADTAIEPCEVRRYARELFGFEVGEETLLFERTPA